MAVTQKELDSFYQFACDQINNGGSDLAFAEIFDIWRIQNPTPQELRENVLAVKAAIRDMENGERGRPFEEFAKDFRQRNNISADA